ncbi:MAG: prolipoprotein diacylglyceryl transferase [Planctomycetales bacterium]
MRQTLFRIPFDLTIPFFGSKIPVFGWGLLLSIWVGVTVWQLSRQIRRQGWKGEVWETLIVGGVVSYLIVQVPQWLPWVPVYGFGAMLLLAILGGGQLASIRVQREGLPPELAWDAAIWILIPGIIGARIFNIAEYWSEFVKDKQNLLEILQGLVMLPNGGLTLYGGVILGGISFFIFCRRKNIQPAYMADMAIPSIFVGEMFGRLGCFLNGCCYGDPSSLPWAVSFPKESFPYMSDLARGRLVEGATCSLALHPTQIYSSINALILALLTWHYFPFRRRNGDVLLLGWLVYPVTRFLLEVLRGDEPGFLGSPLTVSQWVSIGMFATGLLFWGYLSRQPAKRNPHLIAQPSAVPVHT